MKKKRMSYANQVGIGAGKTHRVTKKARMRKRPVAPRPGGPGGGKRP
tara:strand:- start:281 stop:421 length:141 start_codon:yes stop_codon:yes gene_type:complete